MATVKVTTPAAAAAPARHPHVTIVSTAGRVTLGLTDSKARFSGLGGDWRTIDRPGSLPLARRAGRRRMQMELTATLIDGMGGKTVEAQMLALDAISASSASCGVSYAEAAHRRWLLFEPAVSSIDRAPISNKIVHADVTLTFVVVVNEELTVAAPSRKPASKTTKKTKAKTVTVRRGDTLAKIAARVYGNAARWPHIAQLNHLRNPNLIRPGQKLKV